MFELIIVTSIFGFTCMLALAAIVIVEGGRFVWRRCTNLRALRGPPSKGLDLTSLSCSNA